MSTTTPKKKTKAVGANKRITLKGLDGHPELDADMAKYPTRTRAARMRMLATIGLSVLSGQYPIGAARQAKKYAKASSVGSKAGLVATGVAAEKPTTPGDAATETPTAQAEVKPVLQNLFGRLLDNKDPK